MNSDQYKSYLVDYHYEGEKWCIEIPATSWEDAEARLKRLAYGKVVGEIKMTLPVLPVRATQLFSTIKDAIGQLMAGFI